MDSILTIISEYNPLHLGHLYQLQESIKNTSCKYKVCILSGSFVQRGEPAIVDKWSRAKMALEAGFDIVLELPTLYAISSAENYAYGALSMAKQIKTTFLSFGSEAGNIEDLAELTSLINDNQDTYYSLIRENVSKGYSYPKSQELAISKLFGKKYATLCSSNNILGLEYLRAINSLKTNITPITIKRNEKYKSATEIRQLISEGKSIKRYVPEFTYKLLEDDPNIVLGLKAFEKEILYKLRMQDLKSIPDLPENLITKLKSAANNCNDLDTLFNSVKNKSITAARLKRILLYVLLDIKNTDIALSKITTPYIRVLGIRKESKKLLSEISKNKNVITSVKDFENTCKNKKLLRMLEIDKRATDTYTLAYKTNSKAGLDYTKKLIVK